MKRKFILIILIFLALLFISSCGKNSNNLDKIYKKIDESFIKETLKSFPPNTSIRFEILNKKELSRKDYNYYVNKLSGYKFDEIIVLIDETHSKYYLSFVERKGLISWLFQSAELTACFPGQLTPVVIEKTGYYCYNISSHMMLSDGEYDQYGSFLYEQSLACAESTNELVLNGDVQYISGGVFAYNHEIERVDIKCNLDQIGIRAFQYCSNLKTVHLNSGLLVIRQEAFFGCSNLEYIVIPDSVWRIESKAFNYGKIFLEGIVDDRWEDDFAIGDAEVYYAGEWEYNSEGIPTPLIDR